MQQIKSVSLESPSSLIVNNNLMDLLRHFKYEFLKVLVFLILFAASVIYTSAESKAYYKANSESEIAR